MTDEICCGSSFGTFEEQDKVLVALSGGVDSSVCIQILRDQGFDVQAVVIRFSPAHDAAVRAAPDSGAPAGRTAYRGGLYRRVRTAGGGTVLRAILRRAHAQSLRAVQSPRQICSAGPCGRPSGHPLYRNRALRPRNGGERPLLCTRRRQPGARPELHAVWLPQNILARLCLPVGEFEKSDIREMAASAQLGHRRMRRTARRSASFRTATMPPISAARGLVPLQGRFIGPDGEDLGPHKGVWHYTVGQRKGLNIAYGTPLVRAAHPPERRRGACPRRR